MQILTNDQNTAINLMDALQVDGEVDVKRFVIAPARRGTVWNLHIRFRMNGLVFSFSLFHNSTVQVFLLRKKGRPELIKDITTPEDLSSWLTEEAIQNG